MSLMKEYRTDVSNEILQFKWLKADLFIIVWENMETLHIEISLNRRQLRNKKKMLGLIF